MKLSKVCPVLCLGLGSYLSAISSATEDSLKPGRSMEPARDAWSVLQTATSSNVHRAAGGSGALAGGSGGPNAVTVTFTARRHL